MNCGNASFRDRRVRAFENKGIFAEGAIREGALVDVQHSLAPAVQHLPAIVAAPFDLRDFENDRRVLINRYPGFRIGHVEIGVRPRHASRGAIDYLIPFESLVAEIDVFLPENEKASKQIEVSIRNILIRDLRRLRSN